jgi:metal-responsive CopG/Arc/MetJ family transcriptional regulator
MAKKWKDYDYTAVNLPTPLINQVDKTVTKSPLYNTRADFVKCAVREKIERMVLKNE